MLPDESQIKKLKNSIGYFYPKHLKSLLDDASKGEVYKKGLDAFLQQFVNDYDFILNNPSKRSGTYRDKFKKYIEDAEYIVFGTNNFLKKRK